MKLFNFLKINFMNFPKIRKLSVLDLRKIYAGSFLGFLWILFRHIIVIFVFWFTFYIGLRGNHIVEGVPYLLWLVVGLTPWFFIADGFIQGAGSFIKKAYIVKKIKYDVETLPMTTIYTYFISHLFMLGVVILLLIGYGSFPKVFNVMIFYYIFALFVFLWAMAVLTASLSAVIRDVSYFIQSITSALLWLSPIVWPYTNLPDKLKIIMWFNPIFYLVNGYRNAFLFGDYDLLFSYQSLIFWIEVIIIFLLGLRFFYKVKPVLSDLL